MDGPTSSDKGFTGPVGALLSKVDKIDYKFFTIETNLKALYIFQFHCLFTTSSVKLFVVNVQIFVYNCVFQKKEQ